MVRQCLADARDAATEPSGVGQCFCNEVDSVLFKLYPYKDGEKGNLQE